MHKTLNTNIIMPNLVKGVPNWRGQPIGTSRPEPKYLNMV